MRYRLTVMMLLAVLPVMNVLAAPAPPPSALLDIGVPPTGKTTEQYRKEEIHRLTYPLGMPCFALYESDVKKLPSVARLDVNDARAWLSENLQVTPIPGTSRLRLRFRAGSTAEQLTILNALLRVRLFWRKERIKQFEEGIHVYEKCILDVEKRIKSSRVPWEIASYQKAIDDVRSIHIPADRAVIARLKQLAVIRWAK